jgi:hypothetical protein
MTTSTFNKIIILDVGVKNLQEFEKKLHKLPKPTPQKSYFRPRFKVVSNLNKTYFKPQISNPINLNSKYKTKLNQCDITKSES